MLIKQNSNTTPLVFLMVDSSGHIEGKTGLNPTVLISKNGAAFATPSGGIGSMGYGLYLVSGHVHDTNTLGCLVLHASGAYADPTDMRYEIVAYDPLNTITLGLSMLDLISGNVNTVSNNVTILDGVVDTISGNLYNTQTTLITVSGDISNLNDVSISDIVTSGTVAGWAEVTPVTNLSGISGQLVNISGNLTILDNVVDTVSGNISNLNDVSVTEISNSILERTIDGVTVSGILEKTMAVADGKFVFNPTTKVLNVYKRDNITPLITVSVPDDYTRNRS